MANSKKIELVEDGGITLQGLSWEIENPIGNIVIFQGMEEHLQRYDYFAKALNNAGENLENIGIWPKNGFDRQVCAYDKLVQSLNESGKPTVLFCHSMGSYMGQWYIQKFSQHIDRIVLCGSGAKNGAVGLGYFLAKILIHDNNREKKAGFFNKLMFGGFNKRIKEPKTAFDWLSYNEENVTSYINDPLSGFGPRNGFCFEFLKGMNGLYKKDNLNKIRKDLPIYIITGEEDPVTTYSKATFILKDMYNKLGINNVDTKVYKHARHEILNEDLRDEVIKDVLAFYKA